VTAVSQGEPVWLSAAQVKLLHAESIRLFGGLPGVRDEGLLVSAVARAQHRWSYDAVATPFELAAAYAFGIARNHPFLDGNKRAALLAIRAFLFRNGYRFAPDELDTVAMTEGLAAGSVAEAELAAWVETNSSPR
jgi:death on curing protein